MKTVERTLELFEAFAAQRKSLSLSELARHMDIPVSTCFGLVRTLERLGYVAALKPRGGYYPTKRLFDIARAISDSDPLLERIEPVLSELRDKTGETVIFVQRQQARVMFLDVFESPQPIHFTARAGEFRDIYNTSVGKALLGAMAPAERAELLAQARLARVTPFSKTSVKELESELAASQERGWYLNMGETVADVMAVGMALTINDHPYAVSVVGPIHRMNPVLNRRVKALQQACRQLQD